MLITSGVTVCICTKTENPLIRHWCDWHGNRQTDGRTDGCRQTNGCQQKQYLLHSA